MEINIPSYRKMRIGSGGWYPRGYLFQPEKQDEVPHGEIHEKLGIERGSNVLFFAGAYGDWAHQLAQTTDVHYTDISPKMVAYARRRFEGKGIDKFSAVDAVKWPAHEKYDYLVSFEPVPIRERILVTALRALAYTRGMRVAYGFFYHVQDRELAGYAKALGQYGARAEIRPVEIVSTHGHYSGEKPRTNTFHVFQVDSNETAKKRAKMDLAVIRLLQKDKAHSSTDLQRALAKIGVQTTPKELSDSLERIHLFSKALNEQDVESRHIDESHIST